MPEIPFKKPVPDFRTIVPGVWSDVLDDVSVTFDIDENTGEVRVNIKNLTEIGALLAGFFIKLTDQNEQTISQLRLLNARIEEMGNTGISLKDVEL